MDTFRLGPHDKAEVLPEISPFCGECGYSMIGLPSNRCPECGTVFVKSEWRERLAQAKEFRDEILAANRAARTGRMLGGGGVVLGAFCLLLRDSWVSSVLALFSAGLSLCAGFLGMGVFRSSLVPRWASAVLPPTEKGLALLSILLAALGLGAVVLFMVW